MIREEIYMRLALQLARQAAEKGEVPVGVVIVQDDEIIASAHNEKEIRQDATAHAEMLAMKMAAKHLGSWRLNQATMYCNLEPCPMCAGAMINTRLKRLVYASPDPKAGAAGSVIDLVRYPGLNHQLEVQGGVLQEESSKLLKEFFKDLRRDG